jgi:hypothetical protein
MPLRTPQVQRGPLSAGQPGRVQPGRVDQRPSAPGCRRRCRLPWPAATTPGEDHGHKARADPVHDVPTAGEDHRDRQPRRPGRPPHHLQPGPRRHPGQGGTLDFGQALNSRHRLAAAHDGPIAVKHPHSVGAGDAQVDPDQPPVAHCYLLVVVACCSGGPCGQRSTTTVPRRRHRLSQPTTPTHVLQPAPTWSGLATSLIRGIRGRPRVASRNTRRGACAVLRTQLNATPGTSRDAYATLGPRCGSSTGVPYMNPTG